MDMQASPYDLADWGYPAIRIETPEGKAEYVDYQRAFAAESQQLRERLLQELKPLLNAAAGARGRQPEPDRTRAGQQPEGTVMTDTASPRKARPSDVD